MASIYSQAIGQSAKIMDERVKAAGQAQKQGVDAQSFTIDKTEEFNEQATKAGQKYGKWKKAFSVIAGGAATLLGLGPLAAAAMTAGGTLMGGKLGEAAAGKELTGKWMQANQSALKEGMKKQTIASAITSGVMAGVSAGAAKKAGASAEGAKIGDETVAYTKTTGQNVEIAKELGIDPSNVQGTGGWSGDLNEKLKSIRETEGAIGNKIRGKSGELYDLGDATNWDDISMDVKDKMWHQASGGTHAGGELGYKNIFSRNMEDGVSRGFKVNPDVAISETAGEGGWR